MIETLSGDGVPEIDPVRQYLNEIGTYPLLSAAEEVSLAKRIEAGVYAGALLSGIAPAAPRRVAASRRDLALVAEDGRMARERMIRANLRLVVSVVRRYNRHRLPLLDAIQEGNVGLIRAVEKFDYTKGFKFSTYATWWIRQALDRGVADQSRTIRLPVHVIEEVNKLLATERDLAVLLGHEPTVDEIATTSGTPADRIDELHRISRHVLSLDLPIGDDGADLTLTQLVDDAEQASVPEIVEHRELLTAVLTSVAALPGREARVIALRYGLGTDRSYTLQEIAAELRVSRERVRQLELRALRRLRTSATHPLRSWTSEGTSARRQRRPGGRSLPGRRAGDR